jgi:exonuclease SbcD
MKILHTADWHLGDRLGRIDRTGDLRAAVERVADYCKREAVDVLLVAGDLFSELARPEGLRETILHWQDVFREFLEAGGTVLTLTGNHDNEGFCQTLVSAMTLAAPAVGRMGETVPPGRLYLAAEPTYLRLRDPREGFEVQFVLMPYPTPSHYFKGEGMPKYGSPQEKTNLLVKKWADALRDIRAHKQYDLHAPSVLAAHVHLHGSNFGPSLFRLTNDEDVIVEGAELPDQFDYVALGHIHKPQEINASHVRYCGSIERMDLGEKDDAKGIVLVEIGAEGLKGEPRVIPFPDDQATKVYEVKVNNPTEDLPRLRQEYPNAANDLVKLKICYTAGVDQLESVLRELDAIFPRWYAREWTDNGELGPSLASEEPATKSFAETVRDYLGQELAQREAADRDAILSLADGLLKDLD